MSRAKHRPETRCVCGATVTDVILCARCMDRLEQNLGDLAGLALDLDATLARQRASGERVGARSKEHPLPFDTAASRVAVTARKVIGRWVLELAPVDSLLPQQLDSMARWLLTRVRRMAAYPAVNEFADDVATTVHDLMRAVDRHPDMWFLGPCETEGCVEEHVLFTDGQRRVARRPTELYALPNAKTVRCRNCKVEYDVEEHRAFLIAAAYDQLAHAELIGRAASVFGVDTNPAKVRNYADRGRLVAKGTDRQGRPLYRIGDVIEVAQNVMAERTKAKEEAERKAEERAKRRTA